MERKHQLKELFHLSLYYFDLFLKFSFPFVVVIFYMYQNPKSGALFIFTGWLFAVIYNHFVVLMTEFEQKVLNYSSTHKSRLIALLFRIGLIFFAPQVFNAITFQDYFYSALLTEGITLFLGIIWFTLSYKTEGKTFAQEHGIFTTLLILFFFSATLLPFVIEILSFYSHTETENLIYLAITFFIELILISRVLYKFISYDQSFETSINNEKVIAITLILWFFGLAGVYLFINYVILQPNFA